MEKYKKITEEIEAIQFKKDNKEEFIEYILKGVWVTTSFGHEKIRYCDIKYDESIDKYYASTHFLGRILFTEGDYIIKNSDGIFYKYDQELFEKNFEKLSNEIKIYADDEHIMTILNNE